MTAQLRKAVLLRLPPETLDRVDQARGAMNRTAWLTLVVTEYLAGIELSDRIKADTEYGVPPSFEQNGEEDVGGGALDWSGEGDDLTGGFPTFESHTSEEAREHNEQLDRIERGVH